MRFLTFVLLVSLFGAVLEDSARAEGESKEQVRLVWDAGAGTETCLGPDELTRLVEVELERPAFTSEAAADARTIRVRLLRDDKNAGFRALVTSEDAEAHASGETSARGVERELVAARCRDLDEPLALVVALLADDEAAARESSASGEESLPPPEPEPPSGTNDEIQPLGPVTTAPRWEAHQRDAHWTHEGDVAAIAGFGILPSPGAGAELGWLAEPPSFPALRLRVLGAVSQPAEPVPDATVSFTYGVAGLTLCPALVRGARGRVRICVGADLGAVHAESHGLEDSRETTAFFGQADLALRGGLALGAGWLGTLGVGLVFPTRADRFVYRQDGEKTELFQMAFIPILVTAGIAYEIL